MRALRTLLVASMVVALVPLAEASHSETGTYTIGTTPGLSVVCSPDCLGVPGANIGGFQFANILGEVPVSATIADVSAGPVPYTICQDVNGDGLCGNTNTAVGPLEPRVQGCGTTADLTASTPAFGARVTSVFVRIIDANCAGGLGLGGSITLTYA